MSQQKAMRYTEGLGVMMKVAFGVDRLPRRDAFVGEDDSEEKKSAVITLNRYAIERGFSEADVNETCRLLFGLENLAALKAEGVKCINRYLQDTRRP